MLSPSAAMTFVLCHGFGFLAVDGTVFVGIDPIQNPFHALRHFGLVDLAIAVGVVAHDVVRNVPAGPPPVGAAFRPLRLELAAKFVPYHLPVPVRVQLLQGR